MSYLMDTCLECDPSNLEGVELTLHNIAACLNGHEGDIGFTPEQTNELVNILDNRIEELLDEQS